MGLASGFGPSGTVPDGQVPPQTPTVSTEFSISDLVESCRMAARFQDLDVSLSINLADAGWPEVIVVSLHGVDLFEVRHSSAGLHIWCLLVEGSVGPIGVPNMALAWAMMIYFMSLPQKRLRSADEPRMAVDRLPAWLLTNGAKVVPNTF